MDELEQTRQYEEDNYGLSTSGLLKDSVSLVQDLVDLYVLAAEISAQTRAVARDEVFLAMHFILACRYQLIIATLAALRGHITDAYRSSRLAIEAAAFAAKIKREPDLARTWAEASSNPDAYKKYRKLFSGQLNLFPRDDGNLVQLGDRYDHSSKLSHPSIFGLSAQGAQEQTAETLNVSFNYFQLESDGTEPTRTFFWIIDTHLRILVVLQHVLDDALTHDRKRWQLRLNSFEAKLAIHHDRWRKLIQRDSS